MQNVLLHLGQLCLVELSLESQDHFLECLHFCRGIVPPNHVVRVNTCPATLSCASRCYLDSEFIDRFSELLVPGKAFLSAALDLDGQIMLHLADKSHDL